jgi:hypothetical protein
VDDAAHLAILEPRRERMELLDDRAQPGGDAHRALRRERLVAGLGEQPREVLAGDVLHRDVEVPVEIAALVDRRHLRRRLGHASLQLRATPFREQRVGVDTVEAHQLERHLALPLGVVGQVHVAGGAPAQESPQLETAESLALAKDQSHRQVLTLGVKNRSLPLRRARLRRRASAPPRAPRRPVP